MVGLITLAKYVGWALLILGFIGSIWWGAHTIHDRIYKDGVNAEKSIWEEREAKLSADRNRKILDAEAKVKAVEDAHGKKLSAIETQHIKEIEDANKQKASDVAAARAGTLRLQWASEATAGRRDGGITTGEVKGSTALSNGEKGCELPAEITANLFELADDADRNTEQLAACQAVVVEDRRTTPNHIP